MEIRNAKTTHTHLGFEDHGMFVVEIGMDYGGCGQSFQRLVDPDNLMGTLIEIFRVLHVRTWESIQRLPCRVRIEDDLIRAIGNFLDEEWTDWKRAGDE